MKLAVVGMTNPEVLTQAERGYRMAKPEGCIDSLYDIMLQCWAAAPEARPTFEHLANFFEDFYIASETSYIF